MTEEAFTDEDSEHPRSDRFKARREMINTMIKIGASPKTEQFVTPKGAINASRLREMYKDLTNDEEVNSRTKCNTVQRFMKHLVRRPESQSFSWSEV